MINRLLKSKEMLPLKCIVGINPCPRTTISCIPTSIAPLLKLPFSPKTIPSDRARIGLAHFRSVARTAQHNLGRRQKPQVSHNWPETSPWHLSWTKAGEKKSLIWGNAKTWRGALLQILLVSQSEIDLDLNGKWWKGKNYICPRIKDKVFDQLFTIYCVAAILSDFHSAQHQQCHNTCSKSLLAWSMQLRAHSGHPR